MFKVTFKLLQASVSVRFETDSEKLKNEIVRLLANNLG
jgi:hypothetical protein